MSKKIEFIKKLFLFEKANPFLSDEWGSRTDWAEYLDPKNPRNTYRFVSELINREILVNDGIIRGVMSIDKEKYVLNKERCSKIPLFGRLIGSKRYQKGLKEMLEETDEFKLMDYLYNIWD